MNIQEYSKTFRKNSAFFTFLDVCFHVNRSKIKYLTTEKIFEKSSEFSLSMIYAAQIMLLKWDAPSR